MENKKISLPIEGMSCASCGAKIEGAISKVDGVGQVNVNLATEKASVAISNDQVELGQVVDAVADVGYRIPVEKMTLPIGGMSCASCVTTIEGALSDVPGVVSATVNLATEKATVSYITGVASLHDFKKAVSDVGYEVLITPEGAAPEDEEDQSEKKMRQATFRMRVAWVFAVPVILWMFAEMFFGIVWPNEAIFNLGMILLALPVLFLVGRDTYRGGFAAVRHGQPNMDTLIALGTGVSLLTGPASFLFPVANYAGVAAMIMAFHLTGRYVEETAKGRASQAIRKLLELGAKTARVIRDGLEVEIPIEDVQVGELMLVRPGEKFLLAPAV